MLHTCQSKHYELENRGLEIIKNYYDMKILANTEADYLYGWDAIYNGIFIDFKFVNDRKLGTISLYRTEYQSNVWVPVFPSKADEIWYCIFKPTKLNIYTMNKLNQYAIIHDLEKLNLRLINQLNVSQLVVDFPLIEPYCGVEQSIKL